MRKWLYYYTKRKGSILGSMNVKKINDYICSFALIRNFLEQRHDYAPLPGVGFLFWHSHDDLQLGILFIRIHVLHKNFRGLLKNLNNANRSAAYYMGGKFRVFEGFPVLPLLCNGSCTTGKKRETAQRTPHGKRPYRKKDQAKGDLAISRKEWTHETAEGALSPVCTVSKSALILKNSLI